MLPGRPLLRLSTVLLGVFLVASADATSEAGARFVARYFDNSGSRDNALASAYDLALSVDGASLYATGERANTVVVFRRDVASGELELVQTHVDGKEGVDGIQGARDIVASADGRHVYVIGAKDNAVAWFATDKVHGETGMLRYQGNEMAGAAKLDGAIAVAVSPDGQNVYVAAFKDGALAIFERNAETGALTHVRSVYDENKDKEKDSEGAAVDDEAAAEAEAEVVEMSEEAKGLEGARGITLDPAGKFVYVVGYDGKSISTYARDPENRGELALVQRVGNEMDACKDCGLNGAFSVLVSGDGAHVYTTAWAWGTGSGRSFDGWVTAWRRDVETGTLTLVEYVQDQVDMQGIRGAFGHALSPNGRFLVVSSCWDDTVSLFEREAATGELMLMRQFVWKQDGVTDLDHPQGVAFAPDGRYFYVTSKKSAAIVQFAVPGSGATEGACDAGSESCDDTGAAAGASSFEP